MQNKQHHTIASILAKNGAFAISEIENQDSLSRSSIGKILRQLTDENILIMTSSRGSDVKYKLAVNNKAIDFLSQEISSFTIDEIAKAWNVGLSSAKQYIKKFVDSGMLSKQGLPPRKIIYSYVNQNNLYDFSDEQIDIINKYYAYITPDGQFIKGVSGFIYWAKNKSGRKDIKALAQEYIDTRRKYYKDQDRVFLIDATYKLHEVFGDDSYLEKLFHRDFDSLPVFGKTYLSQMIRIAKSGRTNNVVMTYIIDNIQASIDNIIDKYKIDAIGFIPPTVMRKTQLMSFISKKLKLSLPIIQITKSNSLEPVQQKSLKRIEDRILNANKTIIVSNKEKYSNILLIDDVTGSGSTLNETAKKIITQKLAQKVYGFTITGSAKASEFDVISEA